MRPGFEPPHSPLKALHHSKLLSRLGIFPRNGNLNAISDDVGSLFGPREAP